MNTGALHLHQTRTLKVTVTEEMIDRFADLSGDFNPLHMNAGAAQKHGFPNRVAHGVLTLSLLSRLIGMEMPGDGALWQSLKVEWVRPVFPGDTVALTATVSQLSLERGYVVLKITGRNQNHTEMLRGLATVGIGNQEAQEEIHGEAPALKRIAQDHDKKKEGDKQVHYTAFVTGASGGIGSAIALELGRLGLNVAVVYRGSKNKAEEVAKEIRSLENRHAMAIRCDVEKTDEIDRAMAEARESLGPVVAVVHAATPPVVTNGFESQGDVTLEHYLRTYITAGLHLAQAVAQDIRVHKWGRIVFVGTSFINGTPPAQMTGYIVGKHGLLGLMKSLAVEIGPLGGTVNMVSPSMTRTELTRDISPRIFLREAQSTPVRRIAEPKDTAKLVAYLMTNDASFVNGANLLISGGKTML